MKSAATRREADGPAQAAVKTATSEITKANRRDHWLARWGYRRSEHRVEPGLYALGGPTSESPVFVTANYTLSFDALRSALSGLPSYILVLDTLGINVWCAAGKGTFGTHELVHRIEETRLGEVVAHRRLILPQLGAPGVSAHKVRRDSGFKVEYGPICATDIHAYLRAGRATPEMRQVRFDLRDRAVLIPVELMGTLGPVLIGATAAYLVEGPLAVGALLASVASGTVLFPLLLPYIPTRDFSSKGYLLGALVAAPFALALAEKQVGTKEWRSALGPLGWFLTLPSLTAFLALNFTGATTFTSKSGVRREMNTYIPYMAGACVAGLLAIAGSGLRRLMKGTNL